MIKLYNKKDCTGCYACSNICPNNCISMEIDTEGFWYPFVNLNKCIKCERCIKVCPIINPARIQNNPRAYGCINKDLAIRLESSSGGIFSLLAEEIIKTGGIVFGAGFNEKFEVGHSYVCSESKLGIFRGSKYAQSRVENTLQQTKIFLDIGQQVLFTGTPCQIAGLKAYLGQEYENLLCVDIICHGVPSPKILQKYKSYRENVAGKSLTKRIAFRLKDEGWKRFSVLFLFENSKEYRETFDKDLYMRAFLKNICLRPSCYTCKFKTLNRQSDITLADFWGIENVLPLMDDDKGTSLIFVNSIKGQEVFEKIKTKTIHQEVDIELAVKYNPAAIKSADYNYKRDVFLREIDTMDFDKLVKKYCSDKFFFRLKRKVKYTILLMLEKIGFTNLIRRIIRRR